jgi:hypothetical protein
MRNQLQKAAADVNTARSTGVILAGDLEAKQALLETARQRYQVITRKLAAAEKEADKVRLCVCGGGGLLETAVCLASTHALTPPALRPQLPPFPTHPRLAARAHRMGGFCGTPPPTHTHACFLTPLSVPRPFTRPR